MRFNRIALAMSALVLIATNLSAQPKRLAMAIPAGKTVAQEDGAKHQIAAKALKARLDKHENTIIIDARGSLSGQMIQGAVNVPSSKVDEWANGADKSAFIVTYCTCPHDEAAEAEVQTLRDLGFRNAYSLIGGLNAAQAAGISVVPVSE